MTIDQRIQELRKLMQQHGIEAYLVPSSDPHQSEYVADHWKSREWLSGFTGSAGTLIVTPDHAGLWTDSRYFLQAEQQLAGSEVTLHKQVVAHAPEHVLWLRDHLKGGSSVGCDGFLFSLGQMQHLRKYLDEKNIAIHDQLDFIGEVWDDRPALPTGEVFPLQLEFAGQSRRDKLDKIRQRMAAKGAAYYLVSTLDDIAWTLNLRGNDVDFNPVFISYLFLSENGADLFIDEEKVPAAVRKNLEADGVRLRPYASIVPFLEEFDGQGPVLLDPSTINVRLFDMLSSGEVIKGENLPRHFKAVKNETEIGHIRRAMIKDGLALVKLYRWLEAILEKRTVTEYEVARQLGHFRRAQGNYFGESFSAIVGYNANGAIVHYRPEEATSAAIRPEGLLLLDSGGQYLEGTTDITRTTALGTPTDEQRRNFTLVLKGHIALATIQFPVGTTGLQLDPLARMYLWKAGLNYGHGTGHGVGYFLNVHEPPQGFAASGARGSTPFQPGMLTSNEPGFYKDGHYGIRIENLVLCMEGPETDYGKFLEFETMTLFPIDLALIDAALLDRSEKDWLNRYHEKVFENLSPYLTPEEVDWLERKCRPVG